MALEVGIVGLPSSGKTTLFRALTRAETHGSGKEHVGMAQIPDERLDRLAAKLVAEETVDSPDFEALFSDLPPKTDVRTHGSIIVAPGEGGPIGEPAPNPI